MWSPNGKVWSPEMKNVDSKILQSRSVMMIGASLTFRSKGDVYTNAPHTLLVPIFALCGLPLSFSQKFSRSLRSLD